MSEKSALHIGEFLTPIFAAVSAYSLEGFLVWLVSYFDLNHLELYARYAGAVGSLFCAGYLVLKFLNELRKWLKST